MNSFLECFGISKGPSLDPVEVEKLSIGKFVERTMQSATSIMSADDVRRELTSHLNSDLTSHPRADSARLLRTMFDAASAACGSKHDRDVVEWLRVCVLTAVKVSNGEGETNGSGGGKTARKAKKSGRSNSLDDFVVDDDEDADYTPSDEEEIGDDEIGDDEIISKKPGRGNGRGKARGGKTTRGGKGGKKDNSANKENVPVPPVKTMEPVAFKSIKGLYAHAYFFPGLDGFSAFIQTLDGAEKTLDICVFSITDDDVADALIRAKKRGVKVRIITDEAQSKIKGADVSRLSSDHNIPYKTNHSHDYMHHKFAILDHKVLINGSYNWSKHARTKNNENFIVSNWPNCTEAFETEFEKLWAQF